MFNMKKIFKIFICIILIMLFSNKYYTNGFDETKVDVTNNETSEADIIENDDDGCIASLSEVKNKKSESENYGDTDAWMYWYLTDDDTVLHLTSTYDENYNMVIVGNHEIIEYKNLQKNNIEKIIIDNEIEATSCNEMFANFYGLKEIENLNLLNTSKVENFIDMFKNCEKLKDLDLSNLDTSNATSFGPGGDPWYGGMFGYCSSLTSLDLSSFNTANITSLSGMFYGCYNLTSINLSSFNVINVTDFSYMFGSCRSLTSIDVSNFNTSSATSFDCMFSGCSGLTSIDVSNFNTSSATSFSNMFSGCSSLTSIDVSNFNTSSATSFSNMFSGCSGLTSIDVSNFNTSIAKYLGGMFFGCSGLTNIDVSNFNTSSVTSFCYMFSGCSSLTSIDVSNFNTSNAIYLYDMFSGCSELSSLNLNNFNTLNVTLFNRMFSGCTSLRIIDLSNFNTSNGTGFGRMFENCTNLKTIYVSELFTTEKIDDFEGGMDAPFIGCINLVGGNGTTYDENNVEYTYARIDTTETPGYFTSINDYVAPSEDNDNKDPSSGGSGKNNNSQSNKNNNGSGSDGSSGGGGGGSSDLLPQNNNQIIDVHRISYDKIISKTIDILKCRWVKDLLVNKWQLFFEDGSKAINGFYIINNIKYIDVNNVKTPVVVQDTYYFDANGYMITGWLQTKDKKWYFFDISNNEDLGKMIVGWKEVQGSYYYFNIDGTMMTGGITPDGYTIGADGKWVR